MSRRVVITGLGALTPLGNNVEDFWKNLVNGVSGAAPITHFDVSQYATRFACELKNFSITDYMDRKEARKHDLYSQYAMVASDEAIKDAGINETNVDPLRAGVLWGSGIGGVDVFYDEVHSFGKSGAEVPKFNPFFIPKMIVNMAAGNIAIKHGFQGPCVTTVTACASSGNAIMDAYLYIQTNRMDIAITGGSEATINPIGIGGFNALRALSTRNDDPTTASRPFDKDRDGFVMGEGAGSIILEEYDHAKARGAKIYAELIGVASTCDAYHMTAPDPNGKGAARVMKLAVESANISPEEVDYINVHGTSTPLGDIAEPKAIRDIFGLHADKLSISATKSMTGHLLGAAGVIEGIASILAIKDNVIPPTINHYTDDPEIEPLDYTFNKAKQKEVNVSLSNTFGFGGHNTSIVFKKID